MIEGQSDPMFVFKTDTDGNIFSAGYDVSNLFNTAGDKFSTILQGAGSSSTTPDLNRVFKNVNIPCGIYCNTLNDGPMGKSDYLHEGVIEDDLYDSLMALVNPYTKSTLDNKPQPTTNKPNKKRSRRLHKRTSNTKTTRRNK